jgi:Uma2 family endonuclease
VLQAVVQVEDYGLPIEIVMVQLAERAATYEDLLAVPDHLVAEILFGHLVTHPRPAPRHSGAASVLGALLIPPFQLGRAGPGGWIFLDEPELHLGEHVVVPDIAGWRRERLSEPPEAAWIDVAPDWICEVLSPSTEAYDRGEKRTIYAEAGVGHLWHVDPRPKMLEVFELRDRKWLLLDVFRDNADVAAPPFAAAAFSLGLLWPFDATPAA